MINIKYNQQSSRENHLTIGKQMKYNYFWNKIPTKSSLKSIYNI